MFSTFKIGLSNIKIESYSPKIIEKIMSKQFIVLEGNYPIDKEIYIYKKINIFKTRSKYADYARKHSENWTIHIYHDVVKGLIIYSKCENKYIIVGQKDFDCICLFKALILKIYSDQLCESSIAFHASSFELNDEAYVFLGNGNTGKSTILFSFADQIKDIKAINDDFVMCHKENNELMLKSLPLKCAIRKASLKHLNIENNNIFNEKNYLGDGDQYYIDMNDIFNIPYSINSKLKYMFFFKTNASGSEFSLKRITDRKLIAKLVTINMTSFKIKVNQQILLNIINSIIDRVKVYELILPFDMTGFATLLLNEVQRQI